MVEFYMWQEIEKYGKKLVAYGLNHSHFGNISMRRGDTLLITKSGCLLDEINEQMLVEVNIQKGNAANALVNHKAAITKGHGIFAAGETLEQAYVYTCSVEHICQLKYFCDLKTFLIKGVI
jgi:ribulose-5-phosphate 4-epimerase/fuculose-1-phosphate aldolase